MSSFQRRTKNPETGEFENAWWLDDYFGRHRYGVQFSSGKVYRKEEHKWEFDEPRPALASPAESAKPEMVPSAAERVNYIEDADFSLLSAEQRRAAVNLVKFAYRDGIAIGRAQVIAELAEPAEGLVEAAAQGQWEDALPPRQWEDTLPPHEYPWDKINEPTKTTYRMESRAALRAAAKYLKAKPWRSRLSL